MLQIERIPTELFDANCYLIFVENAAEVLVVDPGVGSARTVKKRLADRGQTVGAVLLTHGHPDHVWESAQIAGEHVPVYVPGPDRWWLDNPVAPLGLERAVPPNNPWRAPARLLDCEVGAWEVLPELYIQMVPAPGHSEGSAIFLLGGDAKFPDLPDKTGPFALSADVIFAGSIGRTDLPGGDDAEMRQTLRTLAVSLDPQTLLLPGHGPATTWQQEMSENPFVKYALPGH